MGRPIKKKFFGNTITPYQDHATGGKTGVGGEGVLSVSITNSGTTAYSQGISIAFSAPNITGGIQATGTASVGAPGLGALSGAAGKITAINITNPGSGYSTAPTMTITTATDVTSASTGTSGANVIYPASTSGIYAGMKVLGVNISASATYVTSVASGAVNLSWPNAGTVNAAITFIDRGTGFNKTVNLTSGSQDAIAFASKLVGGSVRTTGDILKQEGSHRYLVQNTDGKGICKLVVKENVDLLAGEMNIIATDYNGNTYFVTKLTARKVRLEQYVNNEAAWLVADGATSGWTIGAATATRVSIAHTI
jgi:hypothetical protein